MAWIGEMLVEGLAGAVDKNGDKAVKAVKGMASDMLFEVQSEAKKIGSTLEYAASQAIQTSVAIWMLIGSAPFHCSTVVRTMDAACLLSSADGSGTSTWEGRWRAMPRRAACAAIK